MKKLFKLVIEQVLEIIFTNLQVHTTGSVTFAIQKPLDTQVMMLAVWPHANAIQLVRCRYKVPWVKCLLSLSNTNLFSAEKNLSIC